MRSVAQRSVRRLAALGSLVVLASVFASGSYAATTPTLTVTCGSQYYGLAVFSWSGAPSGGSISFYSGERTVRLPNPQRSGKLEIGGVTSGPALYAQAQMFSAADKTGAITKLGEAVTPTEGCPT